MYTPAIVEYNIQHYTFLSHENFTLFLSWFCISVDIFHLWKMKKKKVKAKIMKVYNISILKYFSLDVIVKETTVIRWILVL